MKRGYLRHGGERMGAPVRDIERIRQLSDKPSDEQMAKHKALAKKLHVKNEGGGTHKSYVSEISMKKGAVGRTKHLKLTEKGHHDPHLSSSPYA